MNGKTVGDLILEKAKELSAKLPFTATGMKTSKNQDIIDNLGYNKKVKDTSVKAVKEPEPKTVEVKADVITELIKKKPKRVKKKHKR